MAKKPANHGKRWTKSEEQQLKKPTDQNKPTTSIAKELKRTQVSIGSKAQSLGVSLQSPN